MPIGGAALTTRILVGDCRERMAELDPESVDSIVTDPPYELGFMGKSWDRSGIAFDPETWAACLRVLKPGGHLLAFGGTRTVHRIASAIEDAGFEIRDQIAWLYSQGFPKSHNIDKLPGICRCNAVPYNHDNDDVRRVWQGVSDLSSNAPAGEESDLLPAVQRRASGAGVGNARAQGALWLDGSESSQLPHEDEWPQQSGMEGRGDVLPEARQLQADQVRPVPGAVPTDGSEGRLCDGASPADGEAMRLSPDAIGSGASHRPRSAAQLRSEPRALAGQCEPQSLRAWPDCPRCGLPMVPQGLGTALKPALEPIIVARKPLIGSVIENVLAYGTGAINVDGCRIETEARPVMVRTSTVVAARAMAGESTGATPSGEMTTLGRWPANVVLDEAAGRLLDEQTGELTSNSGTPFNRTSDKFRNTYSAFEGSPAERGYYGDSGGASRFFYCAKADGAERSIGLTQNNHPTVKPISLMRWLVRLVTPPGGTVLDPFMGSGTTGIACDREGFHFIGMERSPEYAEIARKRITGDAPMFADVTVEPATRAHANLERGVA